ncbi:MAG: hypothetical protein WBM90_02100, partial [Acidimicrobiia bacterium]
MRRALGLVVVAALMAVSSVALAGEPYASYLDRWNEVSYSGNDGSLKWGSAWSEFGDDNRPESGILHVYTDSYCADYKCLHIEGKGDGVTFGVKRFADLSVFQEADICFELTGYVDEELSDGQLLVQVTTDGSSWKTVASYELAALGGYFHPQIDLTDFRTKSFGVKFAVVGVFYGELFLDTVELKGLLGS